MLTRKTSASFLLALALAFSALPTLLRAEEASSPPTQEVEEPTEIDFDHEDTFIDRTDAIRSKQYVRRAILSSVIRNTSQMAFSRPYINHLMGFSAVYQKTTFAKFVSGVQGLSVGYITEGGHGFEAGLELAAVSNAFVGYRYVIRPETFSLWPFLGAGIGTELTSIKFADAPPEAEVYDGQRSMAFGTLGLLVPLVDVGIKVEARFNFYGADRMSLASGVGVIIFL